MLNKPPEPSDMMGQAHQPNTAASMHVPQDLVYKLLHVQEVCIILIILFIQILGFVFYYIFFLNCSNSAKFSSNKNLTNCYFQVEG